MEHIFLIDAGHGPDTKGKRSPDGTLREYNFNHPTAQALGAILSRYENTKVYFTYTPGEDTPLETRTDRANAIRSQYAAAINEGRAKIYFISIHANAMGTGGWESAKGIETFVMSPASENPGSLGLAKDVHRYLLASARRTDRGVKAANFHVLRETVRIPAILVECGFMTHREENELLKQSHYRQLCAQGIANGFIAHTGIKPKKIAEEAPTVAELPSKITTLAEWVQENKISDGNNPYAEATLAYVWEVIRAYHNQLGDTEAEQPAAANTEFNDKVDSLIAWVQANGIADGKNPYEKATLAYIWEVMRNYHNKLGNAR